MWCPIGNAQEAAGGMFGIGGNRYEKPDFIQGVCDAFVFMSSAGVISSYQPGTHRIQAQALRVATRGLSPEPG